MSQHSPNLGKINKIFSEYAKEFSDRNYHIINEGLSEYLRMNKATLDMSEKIIEKINGGLIYVYGLKGIKYIPDFLGRRYEIIPSKYNLLGYKHSGNYRKKWITAYINRFNNPHNILKITIHKISKFGEYNKYRNSIRLSYTTKETLNSWL